MSIVDGNPVNASYTNTKLASKQDDNTLEGKQALEHNNVESGANVDDTQKSINDLIAAVAKLALNNTAYFVGLYANDTEFETAQGVPPYSDDRVGFYFNTTILKLRIHDGTVWRTNEQALDNATNTDPTSTDDSASGFQDLSLWLNTDTGSLFRAIDVSVGAAVWQEVADNAILEAHLNDLNAHIDWAAAGAGTIDPSNYQDNDTVYTHPDHSGEVTSSSDGSQTIQPTAISNKASLASPAGTEEILVNEGGTLKKVLASSIAGLATGEVNTASNIGAGEGIFSNKNGEDLELKTLKGSSSVTLTSDADSITIESQGGGGGGELNFYTKGDAEDAELVDFTEGNDPVFGNGGTFQGAFAFETINQLRGTKSFLLTLNAAPTVSNGDYVESELIDIPLGYRGRTLAIKTVFTYDGDDNDIVMAVKDITNGNILTDGADFFTQSATGKDFVTTFYCPADCEQISVGPQVIAHATGGEIFKWDDVVVTPNVNVSKNLIDYGNYRITQNGNALTTRGGETRFNLGAATIVEEGSFGSMFTVEDDSAGNRTKWIANRDIDKVTVYYGCLVTSSGYERKIGLNGVPIITGSQQAGDGAVGVSLPLKKGDFITVGLNTNTDDLVFNNSATILNSAKPNVVSITATATTEHIVHHDSGVENTFSARVEGALNTGNGDNVNILTKNSDFIQSITHTATTGEWDILWTPDFFSVPPSLNITAKGTTSADLVAYEYISATTTGVTVRITRNAAGFDADFTITAYNQGSDYKNPSAYAVTPVSQVAYVKDIVSSAGTSGTFIGGGTFYIRRFSDIEGDSSFISLDNNKITLSSGKYNIDGVLPAFQVDNHQAKLVNTTAGMDAIIGTPSFSRASSSNSTDSIIKGQIIIAETSVFEVHHACVTTKTNNGFGNTYTAIGLDQVFSQLRIEKVK